ncbi:hypothetical protein MPTK2_1g03480 [Marchantia polymorpha subsp. ruderalis]
MAAVATRLAWLSSYGASLSSRQPRPGVQFSTNRHTSAWSVRCSASVQSGTEVLTTESAAAKADAAAWKAFAERVSGEWDGYGADFTFTGEPLELPSSVVPDAFRDWGVEIHDWQTMCPTLAVEESQDLSYRVIRLLPTVGCEADAATPYCNEERTFRVAKTYAFHAQGSYTAVWPGRGAQKNNPEPGRTGKIVVRDVADDGQWEVEHCLVTDDGPTRNRARVLQQFRLDRNVPVLKNITLYIEQWDGPFRNGESLGGCSTSGSGFATTPPLDVQALVGTWHADVFFAPGGQSSSSPKEFCPGGSSALQRTQVAGIVALPKGLWSSVTVSSQDSSSYIIEAGWMPSPDQCIVSTCEYLSSGDFKSSSIRFEKRK